VIVAACVAALGLAAGCRVFEPAPPGTPLTLPALPGQPTGVFTTAQPTVGAAISQFFGRRPVAQQPIEFPHNVHAGKGVACAFCHQGVNRGPAAGLPGVTLCMSCHQGTATDRPRIQQIAALRAKGLDLAWQPVYGFVHDAHVVFNHAAHIRGKVECATCHGDVSAQTVAQVNVDMTMGFCVNCHQERKASVDCMTCHF